MTILYVSRQMMCGIASLSHAFSTKYKTMLTIVAPFFFAEDTKKPESSSQGTEAPSTVQALPPKRPTEEPTQGEPKKKKKKKKKGPKE